MCFQFHPVPFSPSLLPLFAQLELNALGPIVYSDRPLFFAPIYRKQVNRFVYWLLHSRCPIPLDWQTFLNFSEPRKERCLTVTFFLLIFSDLRKGIILQLEDESRAGWNGKLAFYLKILMHSWATSIQSRRYKDVKN